MKRLLLVTLLIVAVTSCTDILDKGPRDEITEETYWETSNDLKLYLNQFYPSFGSHLAYYSMDSNSDNLQPNAPSEILNGTRAIPESGGGWDWDEIREINYFLENAPEVTSGNKTKLDHYMGEGYFFKAYFYFQKLKRFGAVPWYNEVLNTDSEGLKASRDPRNAVADSILNNLDRAIALLQDKSGVAANRVTKGSALLFKSRVALYEGTWEKYHAGTVFGVEGSEGQKYLTEAVKASRNLIDSGNYSLYSTGNPKNDYYKLFNRTDLSGNPEVLLWKQSDPSIGTGTGVWTYLNGDRGRRTGITKRLVDSYLDENGEPIALSNTYKGDTTLTQVVKDRDPRLKQTMWVPGQVQIAYEPDPQVFDYPTLNKGSFDLSTTGYMIRKGSTTDPDQNTGSSSANYGKTDGIVFRYAEALLNYAEAKAELAKMSTEYSLSQSDLDKTINLIRQRIGMPDLSRNVGYTDPDWNFGLSPIINEIRRERRIELALEGFRYDDLMRWAATDLIQGNRWKGARFIKDRSFPEIEDQISGIAVDKNRYIDRYQDELGNVGFGFDETRDYLFPIPTNEITLNENLEQNPGW